ncbi:L-cystatin-like [Uloborus diversus]|uniref:L-cystatin-like n=1 Tax=Uloborus diversus TaxID=327109 RepID=UPI00240A37DA|nr:L-cystatin-like [Uloborus diversus]
MLKVALFLGLLACASCFFVFPNFGNFVQVNVNDQAVIVAANYGVGYMSRMWMGIYHHRLARIVGAWTQVVNGYIYYKLDLIAGVTTCLKQNVAFDLLGQCPFQEGWATYKRCSLSLGRQENGNFGSLSSWACVTIPAGDILTVTA